MIVCDSPSTHQRAADNGEVATEAALPEAVAQHRHLHIVGDFLLGEDAAGAGLAAERREEAGGDAAGRDAFRLAVAGDRAIGDPDALESFEALDPLAKAHEGERIVRRRAREGRRAGRLQVEADQAIRIGKGQRAQEDRVGDRQHRADGSDDHLIVRMRPSARPGCLRSMRHAMRAYPIEKRPCFTIRRRGCAAQIQVAAIAGGTVATPEAGQNDAGEGTLLGVD